MSARPGLPEPLQDVPAVAIFRGLGTEAVLRAADALAVHGIRAVEVTLDSPAALETIERLAGDPRLAVGAGTVLDREGARAAVEAGAAYLVSPTTSTAVLAVAEEAGVAAIPGALTPTEIVAAWRAGASAVKVFPVGALGPQYVKAVSEPLAGIPLIPTGGIDDRLAGEYLRAGAAAVGLGGWLVGSGDPEQTRERAASLVAALRASGSGGRENRTAEYPRTQPAGKEGSREHEDR